MALARAAMEARDWVRARETLNPLVRTRPSQGALLLMAEVEEGEHGDLGRAREWLSRAVHAPRDRAWVADGLVLQGWAPVSPVSGLIDAVEWKVPAEQLGGPVAIDIDDAALEPVEPGKAEEATPPADRAGDGGAVAGKQAAAASGDPAEIDAKTEAGPEKAPAVEAGNGADDSETVIGAGKDVIGNTGGATQPAPASAAAPGEDGDASGVDGQKAPGPATSDDKDGEKNGREAEAPPDLPRPPDDPGIEEIEAETPSRRFKLF
jgi:HemY protein